jgi:hypothetical protein
MMLFQRPEDCYVGAPASRTAPPDQLDVDDDFSAPVPPR